MSDYWKAVLVRAGWTAAEVALGMIPVGVGIKEVGWTHILSVCAVAAVVSVLKSSVVGVPEVKTDEEAEG